MYAGQNIVRLAYGDKLIRPKSPKVKTLPIAHNITEAHSDFPLYIKPSAITGFGSLTLAEAQSLRFYADAGKTTELPREIVSADEIYVKNTLATGTGNKLYLDWDGVSSDYAVSDTYGARNVWNSNYKAVYHFEGNANDSTSNGNNGIDTNVNYISGKMGNSVSFAGDSSSYSKINGNYMNITTYSLNMWIYINSLPGGTHLVLGQHTNSTWGLNIFTNGGDIGRRHRESGVFTYPITTGWHFISLTRSGNAGNGLKMYIDGQLKSQNTVSGGANSADFYMGYDKAHTGSSNMGAFKGLIDNLYINTEVKTSTRISTEYANQSNPATFFGTLT